MHEGLMVNDLYRTLCDGELLHTNICAALSCLTINPVTVSHTHTHTGHEVCLCLCDDDDDLFD